MRYGRAGFVILWMLNYVGMLSVWVAYYLCLSPINWGDLYQGTGIGISNNDLDGSIYSFLYDTLDNRYASIVFTLFYSHALGNAVDVSVCIFPIDVLPRIYHYGYAAPFYNISRSTRSIVFGTKNTRKSFASTRPHVVKFVNSRWIYSRSEFWRPLFVGHHLLYYSADVSVAYQAEWREAN